jgi:signal peptidase I
LISLSIFIFLSLTFLLLEGWLIALSAHAVGSSRGRLRYGILALLILCMVDLIFILVQHYIFARIPIPRLILELIMLFNFLVISFIVFKCVFRLTFLRTFVPLGLCVAFIFIFYWGSVGLVKPYLIQAFSISSNSMAPTFEKGDRICVNKIRCPQRWDIICHRSKEDYSLIFCRRVIGLPGEHLRFEDNKFYVNGKNIALPAIISGRLRLYIILDLDGMTRSKDGYDIKLMNNEYFVIGDNIDISIDSRMYGPVDSSLIDGVVDWVYWPLNKFRILQ